MSAVEYSSPATDGRPSGSSAAHMALPPHNLDAERSVLGAVLLDERHLHGLIVEEQLRPEHFYREQHGAIYGAMLELYRDDRKIDHLTVSERLRQNNKLDEIGGRGAVEPMRRRDRVARGGPYGRLRRHDGTVVQRDALVAAVDAEALPRHAEFERLHAVEREDGDGLDRLMTRHPASLPAEWQDFNERRQ